MLSLLHIENIALIDCTDIGFRPGFNVLTGETGAGKSIVIDAIGAVMGGRTSRDLIRTGEKYALVRAEFTDVPVLPAMQELGVAPDAEGRLTLIRRIQADGKNVCRVGETPCTVNQLRSLGRGLLDIHGQHDGQQLLDDSTHLGYLDSFGRLEGECDAYRQQYQKLERLRREIAALQMDESEKARRIDSLRYQIEELEEANLRPGEEAELDERRQILGNADRLMDSVSRACSVLSGGEEYNGAVSLLSEAVGSLSGISGLSDEFRELSEELEDIRCRAEDAAWRLRDIRDRFDFSPEELDKVESRLDQLYRLRKKYGSSSEEMLAYLEERRRELSRIEFSEEELVRLEGKREKLYRRARELALQLSEHRRQAAAELKTRIESELSQLDMPKVRFEVEFSGNPEEAQLADTGLDTVCFLMSANVGEKLKPISRVASGGELSRIMLALKNVLAENDSVSTMIFDEIDTGISGRAAGKVARKMQSLSAQCQILCVTHLPQIAAGADTHFVVHKQERDGRTFTDVETLDWEGRKLELARLTGGERVTDSVLRTAEELLKEARGRAADFAAVQP